MKYNMDELTIDRSLDQTAEHIHHHGQPCPACGFARFRPSEMEARYLDAEGRVTIFAKRAIEAERQLAGAMARIRQFEELTARLAEHCARLAEAVEGREPQKVA